LRAVPNSAFSASPSSEIVTGGTNRSTILNERAARISRCPSPSVDEIIPARNATTQAMTSHMTGNPEPVFEASCALDRIDQREP
jgi:hypothetical protein